MSNAKWVWLKHGKTPAAPEDFKAGEVGLYLNEPPNEFGQHVAVVDHWATYADDSGLDVSPEDAALIASAPELAAENARLRAELARAVAIIHGEWCACSLPPEECTDHPMGRK